MITIGVDAHKRVHVALALDAAGREVSDWRGMNLRRRLVALKSARRNGREALRANQSAMCPEF